MSRVTAFTYGCAVGVRGIVDDFIPGQKCKGVGIVGKGIDCGEYALEIDAVI